MDRQSVFDTVRDHLLNQQSHCTNDDNCVYSNFDGKRCAIGALIPADCLPPADFIGGVDILIDEYPEALAHLGPLHAGDINFLSELQDIHDQELSPKKWSEALTRFAHTHGLTP